ncbi:GNAT family N-acetyltransferase [Listeria monocytogenes]|nr:GNAT family N-acetyltransferase [Listeria monocytogenes]EAC6741432.1 GNAT family N-acetyltransferase [Listeria monocytogenes]EAD0724361.1 GNAT family N-acetyltransferase [Listeria monocytogenes]EHC6484449.1 GNAT family N-acetyltransferase [Listeria monocytogenes]EIF2331294.1 GNAT family N-acetyltransferase [Listeria monocytogenes]
MIKLCTISDSQALLEISYKTFDETFRVQNKPENMDAYLKTNFTAKKLSDELKKPHSYFYFAFHQEAIAGYLKLNIGDAQTEEIAGNTIEIERIYVLKSFQKKGLGKELFNQAIEIAKEVGAEKIWLGVWEKNKNAIQFYEKLGFIKNGQHDFFMGDDCQTDIIMIKDL